MSYATIDLEPIYAALFAQISGTAWIAYSPFSAKPTFGRRLVALNDVTCPYIALIGHSDEWLQMHRGVPPNQTSSANVYFYTDDGGDAKAIPDQMVHSLMKSLSGALDPGVLGRLTLGGLVDNCWIVGRITEYLAAKQGLSITVVGLDLLVTQ